MCWILGDEHHCRPSSTNSGGSVLPFTRDLCLWLVLCLTYIARNVMLTMKISTKCMCFSTYNIASASAFYQSHLQKICKTIRILHVWKSASPQIRILPNASLKSLQPDLRCFAAFRQTPPQHSYPRISNETILCKFHTEFPFPSHQLTCCSLHICHLFQATGKMRTCGRADLRILWTWKWRNLTINLTLALSLTLTLTLTLNKP